MQTEERLGEEQEEMEKLISVEELNKRISWLPSEMTISLWDLKNLIKGLPNKRPSPEGVVMCEECSSCTKKPRVDGNTFLWCKVHEHGVGNHNWCSWGERDDS